jgi:hypothetical protein
MSNIARPERCFPLRLAIAASSDRPQEAFRQAGLPPVCHMRGVGGHAGNF